MEDNDNLKFGIAGNRDEDKTQWGSTAGCAVLLDAVSEGVIIADVETRQFRYSNPSICKMLGYSKEEMARLSVMDIHPKKDLAGVLVAFESMVKGEKKNVEVPCLRKDGTVFYANVAISSVAVGGDESILGFFTDISDRKKVEERDALFKILFYASADAIMTAEPPLWKFTAGNPATLKMFMAKDEAEFNSMEPWQLSPEKQPDGRLSSEKAKEMLDIAMRDGSNFFEWIHRRFNGEEFPTTVLLARVSTTEKTFIQATVRDISRQKTIEEALMESEERYRLLVENSHDTIYLLDEKGFFTFVSPSWTTLLGHRPEQVVGKLFTDFIHPEDVERCLLALKKMVDTGQKIGEIEYRVRHIDGSWRWHVSTGAPAKGKGGKIIGFEGIARDVTEKKRTEEEILEKNLLLVTEKETSPDGILVVDGDGKIVSYNNNFVEMWGIPGDVIATKSDELTLQSIMDKLALPKEFVEKVKYLYANKREKSHDEVELIDGRVFDRYSAPMFAGEKYYGRIWFFRDVTEGKRAGKAMKEKLEEIEKMNKFMVDREVKMVALKREMEALKEKLESK